LLSIAPCHVITSHDLAALMVLRALLDVGSGADHLQAQVLERRLA
jgi:hypothetical protein